MKLRAASTRLGWVCVLQCQPGMWLLKVAVICNINRRTDRRLNTTLTLLVRLIKHINTPMLRNHNCRQLIMRVDSASSILRIN